MQGKRHLTLIYQQKETAPTSYYLQEGESGYLPGRVCINRFPFAEVHRGAYRNAVGQFKATFKKAEASPYRNDKGTLHSNIYPCEKVAPEIIGTGDIRGTEDLLIFEDRGGWKTIAIHIYQGCKFRVAEILADLKNKKPQL